MTGGGRGLGRAYALRLARLGATVLVNDLRSSVHAEYDETLSAPSVPDECRALGVESAELLADVTDTGSVTDLFERIDEQWGRLDVLVNNAGGALFGQEWRPTLELNLMGTVNCCQGAAQFMRRQQSGKIVNIASQAGIMGTGGGGPYGVSKAAVIHYTRGLALELGPYGVNVNCMAPGWILSSRAVASGRNDPERRQALEEKIALGRLGLPEDCANVLEFLVGPLSDYVTGQTIPVCGGYVYF